MTLVQPEQIAVREISAQETAAHEADVSTGTKIAAGLVAGLMSLYLILVVTLEVIQLVG